MVKTLKTKSYLRPRGPKYINACDTESKTQFFDTESKTQFFPKTRRAKVSFYLWTGGQGQVLTSSEDAEDKLLAMTRRAKTKSCL